MADNFTEFVLRLASDPQALAQFHKTPDSAISAAGLTSGEAAVLKSAAPVLIQNGNLLLNCSL